MKTALPTRKLIVILFALLTTSSSLLAANEPIPSGSFIINMGVVPQTYANGLKPWGLVYDLIKNYKVQVKWVINQSKVKDGTDFTYNGTNFKGGTFILLQKYRTASVDARIAYWQSLGVVGVTTTGAFTVDVTKTLKYTPRWTFDFQNGNIALSYLDNAGIPTAEYPKKDPNELNDCDDLFIMPHADPSWATHNNLLTWNRNTRGWLWYGCHAGSVIESLVNPLDSTKRMNFLTTTGLVNFSDHGNPNTPYSYRYPTDPEMQFMGTADAAMDNGSEQVYLPKPGGAWRPGTHVSVWDPANPNVPSLSPGEAAIIAYGRAFGDTALGKVMFQAGHNFDKNNSAAVAAQRAFFNFSFLSVADKEITSTVTGQINVSSLNSYTYRVTLPVGSPSANNSYHWTSSCGGTFSKPFDTVTVFTAPQVNNCTSCTIYCTITDGCGRAYYQEFDINICSTIPPVALDRITTMITNADGTGPQPVANAVPLAGTDEDGYLVSYILKSLPVNGVLFYDHDNNALTPDVAINSLPSGELVLTALQMKTLKFDPADGYAGNAGFLYTVADNSTLRDLTPATYTIPVNTPPVAITKICTPVGSNAGKSDACDMQATDNGSIISFTITALPSAIQCIVYINNVDAYVGQVLTPLMATQITFKPTGSYVGYAEIMYTATDNNGAVDITPATLTLQMVNQPPTANDVSATNIANPAGNVMYALPALSATDKDGAVTSYTITAKPAETQGVLYYNNAGSSYTPVVNNQPITLAQSATLKFDPSDNFSGTASLQYTAKDNLGLADNTPATLYIPVQLVPPVAKDTTNPSTYAGGGWQPIYSLAATNPGYTIVSYKVLTIPDAATEGKIGYGSTNIVITAGMTLTPAQAASMKFDPKKGYTGVVDFTYTCTNDIGLTDLSPAIVLLPVHNNAPAAIDKLNAAIANTAIQSTITAFSGTDPDEMPMTGHKFTIISLPSASFGILYLGTIPVFTGQLITAAQASTLKFDPATNSRDTATFTYTVTDECGTADATPAVFKIPITAVLSAPVSADVNMSPISIRQVANPIPALNGTDVDGTIVSFKIQTTTSPYDGTLYLDGTPLSNNDILPYEKRGQLYFIPGSTVTGTIFFKFRSIDNDGLQSTPAYNYITIVNIAPVAYIINMQAVRKTTTVIIAPLSATDSDGVIASYTIASLPTLGNVMQCDLLGNNVYSNVTTGQVLTPAQVTRLRINFNSTLGTSTFTYTATDNSGGTSNVATYSIPVTGSAANQLPVAHNITNASIAMNSGASSISPLSATDLDGNIASYAIISIPPDYYGKLLYNSTGTIYDTISVGNKPLTTAQAATLKFLPSGSYAGGVTFTYMAKDNLNAASALATFTIPVSCPDPVATNLSNAAVSSNSGPALLQSLVATTAGSISGFYITDLPAATQGVLVMDGSLITTQQFIPLVNAGRLEFDPEPSFAGTASFRYTAVDNLGSNDKTPATVTIPVTSSVPFGLERISQVITNTIGTAAVSIPAMSGYDNDGYIVSYTIKTLPTNGVLYVNGVAATVNQVLTPAQVALLSFDPVDNFAGTTLFTFTVKDNSGFNSSPAGYSIVSNLPPVTYNVVTAGMIAGQALTSILPLVATDNGSIASYSILTLPAATDGVLYLNTVPVTSLAQVNSLNSAQVNQLKFLPSSSFSGAIFSYSAYDNMGIIDVTPAVYQIPFGNSMVLPITLVTFTGNKSGADDQLKWSTTQEINSDHFELEYSTTGRNYVKIGVVAAKGYSLVQNDYSFTNKNVPNAVNYYRLKMIDRDNQFKYSPVVALKRGEGTTSIPGNSSVSPNPFTDRIVIRLESESKMETRFAIYDMNGKLMVTKNVWLAIGVNQVIMDGLDGLTNDMYVLKIVNNDIKLSTKLIRLQ